MHISDEVLAMSPRRWCNSFEAYAVKLLLVLISATLCLSVPVGAAAQSVFGVLSGTVTDENQAVVPNVQVTAFSLTTALQRVAVTNDNGEFKIPFLPPGQY